MARTQARYKDLTLFIDINLKDDTILELSFGGETLPFKDSILELSQKLLNHPIHDAFTLSRSDLSFDEKKLVHLPLWLIHKALYDYLGENQYLDVQADMLCMCYGIGVSDIKKEILRDSNFDLTDLIAKTKATSACASCLPSITKTIKELRAHHGIIKGEKHSKTRVDKNGNWIKINDMYPAELLIAIDDLKTSWMKREGLTHQFKIEITDINGLHLSMNVTKVNGEAVEADRAEKILNALSDFLKSEMNTLFFLDAVL